MNAWKPNDEQIDGLVDAWDSRGDFAQEGWRSDFRALANSPAFQSIVRAAQEYAWQQGYLGGHAVFCQAENVDTDGCPTNGEIDNPYEDQS